MALGCTSASTISSYIDFVNALVTNTYETPCRTVDPKVEGSSPFGLDQPHEGCQACTFGSPSFMRLSCGSWMVEIRADKDQGAKFIASVDEPSGSEYGSVWTRTGAGSARLAAGTLVKHG